MGLRLEDDFWANLDKVKINFIAEKYKSRSVKYFLAFLGKNGAQ